MNTPKKNQIKIKHLKTGAFDALKLNLFWPKNKKNSLADVHVKHKSYSFLPVLNNGTAEQASPYIILRATCCKCCNATT